MPEKSLLTRRSFLGGLGLAGITGAAVATQRLVFGDSTPVAHAQTDEHGNHLNLGNTVEGDVDSEFNGFDPSSMLTDFDYGTVSRLPSGQVLREYQIVAHDKTIEIAPGIMFPGWAYNNRIPGPTIRCTEGDRLRIKFINGSSHPHSIHFHGFHQATMDGLAPIKSGGETVYEFDAEPFGLHLYHCHTVPLKRHIHKGLYGAFIIDPPAPRPVAKELMMMMNGFDTNFDNENEIYAVNTVAFHYTKHPIEVAINELVRVYLINITEFDPINSFHLHANLFHVYRTGTRLEPHEFTDMITMAQGERHILEFRFKFPGEYMFHAHQSELAELGWMGIFKVSDPAAFSEPGQAIGVCDLTDTGGPA